MSRPVSWFRLFRGKVWHVGFAQDAAACGSERPADAETVGERAPVNARVCGDCVAATLHLYGLAQAAQMADPRTKTTTLTMSDPVRAEAWDEGHRYMWRRAMSDCICSAWSSRECSCGRYGTGELLSLADNPYRADELEARR